MRGEEGGGPMIPLGDFIIAAVLAFIAGWLLAVVQECQHDIKIWRGSLPFESIEKAKHE